MDSEELSNILIKLNLTQAAASRLLGYDDRTMRRWTGGERSVPKAIAIILRLMAAGKVSANEIIKARLQ